MALLTKVSARDIMKTDVLTLSASAPMTEAISMFREYHISGAPVVDQVGELIGVLSASDITQMEGDTDTKPMMGSSSYWNLPDEDSYDEDSFSMEEYSENALQESMVSDWMNRKLITVAPDDNLKKVCRVMSRESIHRVLVVEEKTRLVGIISALDIVRHIAAAS